MIVVALFFTPILPRIKYSGWTNIPCDVSGRESCPPPTPMYAGTYYQSPHNYIKEKLQQKAGNYPDCANAGPPPHEKGFKCW